MIVYAITTFAGLVREPEGNNRWYIDPTLVGLAREPEAKTPGLSLVANQVTIVPCIGK